MNKMTYKCTSFCGPPRYEGLPTHCLNLRFFSHDFEYIRSITTCSVVITIGSVINGVREQYLWANNVAFNLLDRAKHQVTSEVNSAQILF